MDEPTAATFAFAPASLERREPISTEIARRLLDFVLAGHVAPGERLPSERQLAEELAVGRSAVREAIKALALLGLVEVRQGDGTYLRRTESALPTSKIEWGQLIGNQRLDQVIEARRHLEAVVAGLAAERRDAAAVADLRRLLAEMEAAAGDPIRFAAADVAFHLRVADAAGNDVLGRMVASIIEVLGDRIAPAGGDAGSTPSPLDDHRRVLAAIDEGDAGAARAAMERHLAGATQRRGAGNAGDGG